MSTNFTTTFFSVILRRQILGRSAARIDDSSSINAVSFSSARTTKRFPSSRCASAIQIVIFILDRSLALRLGLGPWAASSSEEQAQIEKGGLRSAGEVVKLALLFLFLLQPCCLESEAHSSRVIFLF